MSRTVYADSKARWGGPRTDGGKEGASVSTTSGKWNERRRLTKGGRVAKGDRAGEGQYVPAARTAGDLGVPEKQWNTTTPARALARMRNTSG